MESESPSKLTIFCCHFETDKIRPNLVVSGYKKFPIPSGLAVDLPHNYQTLCPASNSIHYIKQIHVDHRKTSPSLKYRIFAFSDPGVDLPGNVPTVKIKYLRSRKGF
jgi:hypothetical protein